jgi:hypothetical protein
MELLRVVNIPARRKALLNDMSSTPTLVHAMWQELLGTLSTATNTLATRGGRLASTPPAQPNRAAPSGPDPNAIPVRQADIFRPAVKSTSAFQSLLQGVLEGPVKTEAPLPLIKAGEAVKQIEAKALEQGTEVGQKVVRWFDSIPIGGMVIGQTLDIWAAIRGGLMRYGASRYVDASLPDVQQAIWVIDGELLSEDAPLRTTTLADFGSHRDHGRRVHRGRYVWSNPNGPSPGSRGYLSSALLCSFVHVRAGCVGLCQTTGRAKSGFPATW